jgi:hypothetical protein
MSDEFAERVKQARQRAVAFKTVETFGGITNRRLWLRDSGENGGSTDGHAIHAPFTDGDFYKIVEHEISHVLFQSNSLARKKFLEEYCEKVAAVTKRAGVQVNMTGFAKMMSAMIGILEDHRVNSLWGLLYPGSYMRIQARNLAQAERMKDKADRSLLIYMLCVHSGLDVSSSFSKYKPFLQESFRKVERKGFGATLLATKWLVTQLVSELVREQTGQPSPQAPSDVTDYDPQGAVRQMLPGSGGQPQSGDNGGQDGGGSGGGGWYPPPVDGDLQTRSNALDDLEKMAGQDGQDYSEDKNDFTDPKFPSRQELAEADDVSNQVTGIDANDPEQMDGFMGQSEADMQRIVDEAARAMRQQMTEDDWTKRDAMAKIVFTDVKQSDVETSIEIAPDDRDAIRRLRAQFFRVMGRTKTALSDSGTKIDIQAYIQSRAAGQLGDCFEHEVRGQGFKSVVLLDRSGSMYGSKTQQAERACRIIARATRFPFVDMNVWGFKSTDNGQVDIDRFDRMMDTYTTKKSMVGGVTPLHIAVRLGVRYLERGPEAKQLIVLTDGFPIYQRRDGRDFPTWQLMMYVRDEVLRARKHGIGVTCLFIGHGDGQFDASPKQMRFMFGPSKNWSMVDPSRLGEGLIRTVSSSFINYLRRG